MTACNSEHTDKVANQQHLVCKSLIDGYLRSQQAGQFELENMQPTLYTQSKSREYSYHISSDNAAKFNVSANQRLKFLCEQSADQHYVLNLVDPKTQVHTQLLTLDLPLKNTRSTSMLASQLKTQ